MACSRNDAAWLPQQVVRTLAAVAWASGNTPPEKRHCRQEVQQCWGRRAVRTPKLATWRGLPSQVPVLPGTPAEAPSKRVKKPSRKPSPVWSSGDPSPSVALAATHPQVGRGCSSVLAHWEQLNPVNLKTTPGLTNKRRVRHGAAHPQGALTYRENTHEAVTDRIRPTEIMSLTSLVAPPGVKVILPWNREGFWEDDIELHLEDAWELTSAHGGGLTDPQKDSCAKRQHSLLGKQQVIKPVGEVGSDHDSHMYQVIK